MAKQFPTVLVTWVDGGYIIQAEGFGAGYTRVASTFGHMMAAVAEHMKPAEARPPGPVVEAPKPALSLVSKPEDGGL